MVIILRSESESQVGVWGVTFRSKLKSSSSFSFWLLILVASFTSCMISFSNAATSSPWLLKYFTAVFIRRRMAQNSSTSSSVTASSSRAFFCCWLPETASSSPCFLLSLAPDMSPLLSRNVKLFFACDWWSWPGPLF